MLNHQFHYDSLIMWNKVYMVNTFVINNCNMVSLVLYVAKYCMVISCIIYIATYVCKTYLYTESV